MREEHSWAGLYTQFIVAVKRALRGPWAYTATDRAARPPAPKVGGVRWA